jgi:hypothetical protein
VRDGNASGYSGGIDHGDALCNFSQDILLCPILIFGEDRIGGLENDRQMIA